MWFSGDNKKPWWQGIVKYWLSFGPIPKHVAFIMDGNRRYARRQKYAMLTEGHYKGFEKLTKVLQWCRELQVKEVTVYAFSLENFKRDSTEKFSWTKRTIYKGTMQTDAFSVSEKLVENDIRIRFFGDLKRLSSTLQQNIAKIELFTRKHRSGIINVCIAYTAQDEIRRAFARIANGVQKGLLNEADINECLISQCLDGGTTTDPDLLIRTSGEARLSDFLLWQCSKCFIYFDDVLWPDYDFWNLCKAVYAYQRNHVKLKELNDNCLMNEKLGDGEKVTEFLDWIMEEHLKDLQRISEGVF
ncbi:unnamed protein product [Thelazia callipaeda]|uniref:Alkyl transferase n=1 Tax=Thelazia callipaeda TaxID=103827 RepID=A0A0N5CKN1_THECL|nr:unnamed protein product [Thelazia callipaeda]